MIKYALQCAAGHRFEAWFRSSDAYDRQEKRALISCPDCGTNAVEKQPMAPALITRTKASSQEDSPPAAPQSPPPMSGSRPAPPVELLRAFRQHVMENSQDVGKGFTEEALKIHYGEAEHRPIRGEATAGDAQRLAEEGVEFGLLPALPEDNN